MRGFDVDWYDFTQLLGASPCTRETVQEHLQVGYDLRVPRSSYDAMWARLDEQLGETGAADVVCEVVLATAKPRLQALIEMAERGEELEIRANEPKIIDLLFDFDGEPTEVGAYLLDYKARSERGPEAPLQQEPPSGRPEEPPPEAAFSLLTHVRLSEIVDAHTANAPQSAPQGSGWRLERVRASQATFLKAKPGWKETDLEEFIVRNWVRIDFGLDQQLRLVGRQVRLKETTEKVDLLAREPDGTWVAIELKIVSATGADLTQLQSYIQDLAFAEIPSEQIRGILIAPDFAEKVLNAAGGDRRVLLLRYLSA